MSISTSELYDAASRTLADNHSERKYRYADQCGQPRGADVPLGGWNFVIRPSSVGISLSWFVIFPAIDRLLIARGVDGRQRRAAHRLTKSVLTVLVVSISFSIAGVPAFIVPVLVLIAMIRIGYLFREPLTDLILFDERYRNNQ